EQRKEKQQTTLCRFIAMGKECNFGDTCKYPHDIDLYLSSKPKVMHDIPLCSHVTCRHIRILLYIQHNRKVRCPYIPYICPIILIVVFRCDYGLLCRYATSHMT